MSQSSSFQARARAINLAGQTFIAMIIAIAILMLPVLLPGNSMWKLLFTHSWNGQTDQLAKKRTDYEKVFLSTPPIGNSALVFSGMNPQNPADISLAQEVYFAGATALYPRRLFPAMEGKIINRGQDLLDSPFAPELPWLYEHDVHQVIVYRMTGQQQLEINILTVPPAARSGGAR